MTGPVVRVRLGAAAAVAACIAALTCGLFLPAQPIPVGPPAVATPDRLDATRPPYSADKTGVSDATSALATFFAADSGGKIKWLPAGTYKITGTAGDLFTLSHAGDRVEGDGIGKTILQYANSITLAGDLCVFRVTANDVQIGGLSVYNGTGMTATTTQKWTALSLYTCLRPYAHDLEVAGAFGANTAGGECLAAYQPYSANDGRMFAVVERCLFRDSPAASGVVNNARNNTFRGVRVKSVGDNGNRHAFYGQAGPTWYDRCEAELAGGYSFHEHHAVANIDGSFGVHADCISTDPGSGHFVIDDLASDGTNAQIPSGQSLTRGWLIRDGIFRTSQGSVAGNVGVAVQAPNVTIDGLNLEDACPTNTGKSWVDVSVAAPGFRMANCTVRMMNASDTLNLVKVDAARASVRRNTFDGVRGTLGSSVVSLGGNCTETAVDDNVCFSTGTGMSVFVNETGAASGTRSRNRVVGPWRATSAEYLFLGGAGTTVANNYVNVSTAGVNFTKIFMAGGASSAQTLFRGNVSANANVGWRFNDTTLPNPGFRFETNAVGELLFSHGSVRPAVASAAITQYFGVKYGSDGKVVKCGTSDTVCSGIAVSTSFTGADTAGFIAVQSGAEAKVVTDGAWTAGNYGVLSTGTAGQWSDTGAATLPANKSCMLFLDTGGGAGTARVLIGRVP